MVKWSCHKSKSQQTTEAHVVAQPMAFNIKEDNEMEAQELKDKKTDSIDNMDQKVQEAKEDEGKVLEIPHIDFIFRDKLSFSEDRDP